MNPMHSGLALVALLAMVSPALAHVWIVDASGNGDFLSIQEAVDVAQDDDVVIVLAGTYGSFTIDDESLDVLADPGALVRVGGTTRILHLGPAKRVALQGIEFLSGGEGQTALDLDDDLGSVRVAGCVLRGWSAGPDDEASGSRGLEAVRCSDLSLDACSVYGGDSGQYSYCTDGIDGTAALVLRESRASISRSTARGGNGGDGGYLDFQCWVCGYSNAGRGGDAAYVGDDSFLFVAGSTFVGGEGGIGWECESGAGWYCGGGGNGIHLADATSVAKILDCEISGGPGGGGCGPAEDIHGSNVEFLSGPAKHMDAARLAEQGELVPVSFTGAPFDSFVLLVSLRSGFAYQPYLRGVLLLGAERRTLVVGSLDATGHRNTRIRAPALAPGTSNLTLHLQAVLKNALYERTVTNPALLTVVR